MAAFRILTTSGFERSFRSLLSRHPALLDIHEDVLRILAEDPYNRSRRHPIKKLKDVPEGKGQYRVRIGRWRFRYDIYDDTVLLTYCGLRDESTYR